MPRRLHLDIETFSSVNIKTSGAYKYMESSDFEILLLAYALNESPVRIVDVAQEGFPEDFLRAFLDPSVKKCAHNANFERNAFKKYGYDIPIAEWECSAIKAAYCGLPLSLEFVSQALKLEEKGKLSTGKALIRYFCTPAKPTKSNGKRSRNFPSHDIEKWEEFKRYCVNDVEAEREVLRRLERYRIPSFEKANYILDQQINDRGVLVDQEMAAHAVQIDELFREETTARLRVLTGLENPNSPAQLKEWLTNALGENVSTLAKDSVMQLLKDVERGLSSDSEEEGEANTEIEAPENIKEVLNCRLKLAKSSTKKYVSMLNCVCEDGRAHGLFQFYGASRTGRWAGRLIQLQNLPQNHMSDLELARRVIKSGDYDLVKMLYDNIPSVLSELIRTALIAPDGHTFAVADYSAIEARVLSWVAGEQWRLDVFHTHGKIYEASAAMMFGVPIDSITKGSELRQRGKVAELALGYQGAESAMEKMDREGKIPAADRKMIVQKWRRANPKIVELWAAIQDGAIRTITTKRSTKVGYITFHCDAYAFRIELPSGRELFYYNPGIGVNRFGDKGIFYFGMDQTTKQWARTETYGGKLVENIVQAISRDILAQAMKKLQAACFSLVMHVHDEAAAEVLESSAGDRLERMCEIMGEPIPWAPGLPLKADGYTTKFYKKD